jgi:hypothetical protein
VTEPTDAAATETERPLGGAAAADATGGADGTPSPPTVPPVVYQTRLPRAGELSPGWRLGTALTWIAVVLALAAVWNASVQLGLSTWWLGPRARPQPLGIRLSPFAAPVLMLLGTINQVRWLAWFGLGASAVIIGVGIGDLGHVASIAVTEILVGVASGAISLASLTGTYRRDPAAAAPEDVTASIS